MKRIKNSENMAISMDSRYKCEWRSFGGKIEGMDKRDTRRWTQGGMFETEIVDRLQLLTVIGMIGWLWDGEAEIR